MLLFLSPTGSVLTTAPTRTLFERLKSPNLVAELDAQRTPVVRLPNFLSTEEQARLHEVAREVQREQHARRGLLWWADARLFLVLK